MVEILFLLVGLALGSGMAYFFLKSKQLPVVADTSHADKQIAELKMELNSVRNKNAEIIERASKAEQLNESRKEQYETLKGELDNVHKKYSSEFELLANKILEEKSQKFTDQNKNNLDIILNPLKEKIKDFEEKVEKAYKVESTERITLKAEIKSLIDLNKQVSEEANNLAKALKGENKTQGNWGELILEKVLERSGLIKDREYRLQHSVSNDEGKRIQPDAVIMLPDNKHIIVDSKVSLLAYEAFVNANDEIAKLSFIKEHIGSVRNHIKQLSEKNYSMSPDLDSPDFVLLFIPIESSFSVAVQADQEMFNYAWDRKIVIVSPSTLLATLRTIASIWKQERQSKNHVEIAKTGADLYDKFRGFIEDMIDLGNRLESGQTAYKNAMNKLVDGRGNVVKQMEKLKELGVKTSKDLPKSLIERSQE
ncbi:MAG: DNA recombination protein RmuC [Bacteroidia bacterium]